MTGPGITARQEEAATVSGTTSRASEAAMILNQLSAANRALLTSHPIPATATAAVVAALPLMVPLRFPMPAA